ncbi:hypothetical protein HUU05_21530 [candidate division KSB1 bacterium]|nr:hypothetical protein [candidate division KSB1 bacterium]
MSRTENREELVRKLLVGLRGEEDLRKLCRALGYKDSKSPLPYRNWHSTKALELIDKKLVDTPMVLARAGVCDDIRHDFQIIYTCLLSNDLPLGHERIIVSQLLQQNYPHAVFVFSNADQTNWHFVNVKIEGGNKIRQVFRRISISQEDQKANRLRTAFERIMMLDLSDKSLITALDIQSRCDKAFDVESLNKQFFATFAKVFHNVAEEIGTQSLYKKQAKQRAQVLLNRMLFLYFIQKKGWLDNKQDYLYARFKACWKVDPKGHNYYVDVLAPLFAALSDPDADRSKVGVVPFLNGGLFEERQSNQIRIKNSTFKAIFDNLLEKYNFTVMEDTPLNLEVAVNPDMLGRIFESLILELEKDPDKDLRKLTGSYYTPRPIVHFMCQEALKEYLVTKLVDKNGGEAEMVRTKIDGLMAMPPAEELDDVQVETLTEYFTPSEAKLLQQAILDCRVCDPAVGSGAFPMGMLHEMVATISRLELRLNGPEMIKKHNYVYELKKQIIQNCLYGVDIQEQAVRLCELRLWLSLVVDYQIDRSKSFAQAIGKIDSLPNLSFRIVRGDSLLERLFGHVVRLDEMAKDARAKQLIESLQQDKNDHFVAGHLEEKRRLELKILAKQAELTEILIEHNRVSTPAYQANLFGEEGMSNRECKAKTELDRVAFQKEPLSDYDLETLRSKYFQNGVFPTFIWRANFAEVFLSKSGFDVIITNPPYLSTKHGFGVGN